MPQMKWFWRLVCSPDCSDDCQTNCSGCHTMAAEWQAAGYQTVACDCGGPAQASTLSRWQRARILLRCWSGSVSGRILTRLIPGRPRSIAMGPVTELHHSTITDAVRQHYATQAREVMAMPEGCCSPSLPADVTSAGSYAPEDLTAIPAHALMAALGCGNPLAHADLKAGEVVLDLGSGGGMDAFIAGGRVGPTGRVYGLDMADEMLELARGNALRIGAPNVEFVKGDMDALPLPDSSVDVIISNCVLNLTPDKARVLLEANRVLRPGGRLVISDIITRREVPEVLRHDLTAWAACIGGAMSEAECYERLNAAGFVDPVVDREREYTAADAERAGLDHLVSRFGPEAVAWIGFASASIRARKPAEQGLSGVGRDHAPVAAVGPRADR